MRRGLLQDLANTPTQMACGWRLYEDLTALDLLAGRKVTIDLLDGGVAATQGHVGSLHVAATAFEWMQERLAKDAVPIGLIESATLTLSPVITDHRFEVACETVVVTPTKTYTSQGTATWHPDDARG